MIELRRGLHRNPETGFKEEDTARVIRGFLSRTPAQVLPPLIGTDTIAVLRGSGPGRTILLRADIDALPLPDRSGRAWSSAACRRVARLRPRRPHRHAARRRAAPGRASATELAGNVLLVFQPAEEEEGGGKLLVEKGLLDRDPRPRGGLRAARLAGPSCRHDRRGKRRRDGGRGQVRHHGEGFGRARRPAAPRVGSRARRGPPRHGPAVGRVPVRGSPRSRGALRVLDPWRPGEQCHPRFRHAGGHGQVLRRGARARRSPTAWRGSLPGPARRFGCTHSLVYEDGYVPLVNDPGMIGFARAVVERHLGPGAWNDSDPRTMGAEDFAYYLQRVPGAMLRLGLGERVAPPAHARVRLQRRGHCRGDRFPRRSGPRVLRRPLRRHGRSCMSSARIMVVEDEGVVALQIKDALEGMGYSVPGMALTGEEAVARVLDLEPDLVLMDIQLKGGMNGVEAAGRIRAAPRCARRVPHRLLRPGDPGAGPAHRALRVRAEAVRGDGRCTRSSRCPWPSTAGSRGERETGGGCRPWPPA